MAKKEIPDLLAEICFNTISYVSVYCNSTILVFGTENLRLIIDSSPFLLSILYLCIKKSCCLNLESSYGF